MTSKIFGERKSWPKRVIVEPFRLSWGLWGESKGDISAAYCADTFPKIRTFTHEGWLFATLAMSADSADGYPLIPEAEYNGLGRKKYSHEGRTAIWKKQKFRLGPKVTFMIRERTCDEWIDLMRRQYAHGGAFASGKSYREVLISFSEEEGISEANAAAIQIELGRSDSPVTQSEMLKLLSNKGPMDHPSPQLRLPGF